MNPLHARLNRLSAALDARTPPVAVPVIVGELNESESACRERLGVTEGTGAIFVSVADQSTPRPEDDTP
jgi:hypothetical protein